jgi:hypothetical protein
MNEFPDGGCAARATIAGRFSSSISVSASSAAYRSSRSSLVRSRPAAFAELAASVSPLTADFRPDSFPVQVGLDILTN